LHLLSLPPPVKGALVAALLAVGLAPLVPAAADGRPSAPKLTVMTRNLYVGGDLTPAILAPSREEFERRAAELLRDIKATSFPARAKLLAREIERSDPDLIGLQEVVLVRRSADGVKDGAATPARVVLYDYLKILLSELRARGLRYRVGKAQRNADFEGPTALGYDGRLTDRDVVLVKRDRNLRLRRSFGDTYDSRLQLETQGGFLDFKRGWAAVDVVYRGRRLRFVDTHLEAAVSSIRADQAEELVSSGGPLRRRLPTILVGDLNSDPKGRGGNDPAAYRTIVRSGLRDPWTALHGSAPGLTCCHAPDLRNPRPLFRERLDYVLTRRGLAPLRVRVIGQDREERTRSGLWPSDHFGVVASLRLR
jgi:hypothetical protein